MAAQRLVEDADASEASTRRLAIVGGWESIGIDGLPPEGLACRFLSCCMKNYSFYNVFSWRLRRRHSRSEMEALMGPLAEELKQAGWMARSLGPDDAVARF